MRLRDKVALITGSGTGIGRETALCFATEGAKVVVTCRTVENGMETVHLIHNAGGEATYIPCDITNISDVKNLIHKCAARYCSLDVLVNCAGIGKWGSVDTMEPQDFLALMSVNVYGVYLASHFAVPVMRSRGHDASIINIGSAVGLVGCANSAGYCASKGAVANLTRAMAIDYASDGIRVNCVCPGVVDTQFNDQVLATVDNPAAVRSAQEADNLIGRLQTPRDVANACLFLASNEAAYITGSMLMVDGGLTAK